MSDTAIIIGGGHVAAELSTGLREHGWTGRIVVCSQDTQLPYHRSPLSKGFMAGKIEAGHLLIKTAAAYHKAQVDFELGVTVTALDLAGRTVTLGDRRCLPFAALALATGSRPCRLAIPGAAEAERSGSLRVLRSLADAEAIRAQCTPGRRLVIVGGGYIGLELAASLSVLGVHVTVLEALPRVLARVAGAPVSAFIAHAHQAAGVDIRTSTGVVGIRLNGTGDRISGVECADGSALAADVLVVAVGVLPAVELAEAAGIAIDNGIAVDENARTSAPGVVAAGDCASHPSALYGRRVLLESVPNALEQALTAAATLTGKERPYRQVPWFWSDQYDLRLKSVGLLQGYDRCLLRGDPASRSFMAFYLQGERVLAIDAINRAADFALAKRIVGEDLRIPASVLVDDAVPLAAALAH